METVNLEISKLTYRRMMKLVEYMESLPKSANRHFDMQMYFIHRGDHEHDISDKPTVEDLHTCGTTACAAGWACTMPYFRRLGLRRAGDYVVNEDDIFNLVDRDGQVAYELWSWFFGSENEDKTPKQWAKRVRKLLQEATVF